VQGCKTTKPAADVASPHWLWEASNQTGSEMLMVQQAQKQAISTMDIAGTERWQCAAHLDAASNRVYAGDGCIVACAALLQQLLGEVYFW
jgi:hypothetical protein